MKDIGIENSLKALPVSGLSERNAAAKGDGSFAQTLTDSIKKVNNLQNEADQAIQELMVGETKDIHGTMIALEKADLSFQMMMTVRSKIVHAYEEIMRMQI